MEERPSVRPSMRELASFLGVSASTISLALRNDARVARETCLRIQEYAARHGYRVDPVVTDLMSRIRTSGASNSAKPYQETIGWLNPHPDPDFFSNEKFGPKAAYGMRLWKGAEGRAAELGIALNVLWLKEPGMTGHRMSAVLQARGIRGLLIPPLPKACGHLRIDWSQFMVTALSFSLVRPQFDVVVPDHHHNMMLVLRKLRQKGRRRVGLITPPSRLGRVEDRFLSAYYPYQLSLPVAQRIPALVGSGDFENEVAAWLKKYRPDTVIASSHFRELQAFRARASRLREFEIVQIPHGPSADGVAGVDECPETVGAAAVEHVLSKIHRGERGIPESSRTVLVKGRWIEASSVPAAKV